MIKVTKWDERWMKWSKDVSKFSKDPSTQVGCVLANGEKFLSFGYNGFPSRINDDSRLLDRDLKNKIILHAEENALHKLRSEEVFDAYVYPLQPCSKCCSNLIQRGVRKVFFTKPNKRHKANYDYDLVISLFKEAGVEVIELNK